MNRQLSVIAVDNRRMAGSPRQERRHAREQWAADRAHVAEAADALAATQDVVRANRALISTVNDWEAARRSLDRAYRDAGWLGRLSHRRRVRADEQLRASVTAAIAQRKRSAQVVRRVSADLPAHDWLKDAWR
jgi:hypothetical protein